ncbi:MAG: translocation/assembly module TamB domain-containing protein [Selenomonadaceae bacterium]|nr:translocation/assembly module TamB domain-containing protein [Selenomonadaceae bacterium]
MKKTTLMKILLGSLFLISIGVIFLYSQRNYLIEMIAVKAADIAGDSLGVKVEIGNVIIDDLNSKSKSSLTVKDFAIYDKKSNLIAKANEATINFKLLSLYRDPLSAIDSIKVNHVDGNIIKREDGTWNFNDIKTSGSGEGNFDADILIDNLNISGSFDDNIFNVIAPNLNLNFDSTAEFSADLNESKISALIEGNDFNIENFTAKLIFDHSNISADVSAKNISALIDLVALIKKSDQDDQKIDENDFDSINLNSDSIVLAANVDRQQLDVDQIDSHIVLDKDMNVNFDINSKFLGSDIKVIADMQNDRQIINVDGEGIDIEKILPYIPEEIIPAGVEIHGGKVSNSNISILKRDDQLSISGTAKINDGAVKVEQTEIENINGVANFTDKQIFLNASAEANSQHADIKGKINLDDEINFDLYAKSDSFNPNAIMYLPAEGVAAFNAHLTGTPTDPIVEANIFSSLITYENISASNIKTHFKYQGDSVYLTELNANAFGGAISGDFELYAMDMAYNAHLKADSIDISRFAEIVPEVEMLNGRISGDFGINGVSDELDKLKVYGSATISNFDYEGVAANRIDASFNVNGDDIKIDYASADLDGGGTVGVEGTIKDGSKLDLAIHGAKVDLKLAEKFLPQIEISGLADFDGTIHGDSDNPDVNLKFSAVDVGQFDQAKNIMTEDQKNHYKGRMLNQPYDAIKFTANGSLDGVQVNDFKLTYQGKEIWLARGSVGLTGEKKINLRIDTVGARAEDIIKLVAADQELTGNVDNVITISGTLDKPEVVGYVHFWRGSYLGALVNGMDGDYFIEGNEIRLQDFHINSPMVDMDLNGTIDKETTAMNFTVEVHDIDVARFQSKLPENYPANGHGKFSGKISGDLKNPKFDGELIADNLNFNGVEIDNVNGHVSLDGDDIFMDNFDFDQGEGKYNVRGKVNYIAGTMSGVSEIVKVDIANLLALANLKNEIVNGTLEGKIQFGGSMMNPTLNVNGNIAKGTIAGSEIHDVNLNVNLLNRVVYVNQFEGYQGENGELTASGTANLNGDLDLKLNASNLALEMFTKAAGLKADVVGNAAIDLKVGGTVNNPSAEAELIVNGGGVNNSTFDLLKGTAKLINGIVDVEELKVQKAIGEKIYQVSANGKIPLISLTTNKAAKLQSDEQINLNISLDNADLSLLPVIGKDYVAWAMGDMAGNLKVTGTAANPLINGTISLLNGSTKIKGMKNLIERMNVILKFNGEEMTIEDFSGMIGGGKYDLSGGLSIANLDIEDYNFKLTADKLNIKSGFFNGELNGEFTLNREQIPFGKFPKVAGHLDFDNCTISIPSIPESEGDLPTILLDVSVKLGKKVHFYSPYLFDLYMEGEAKFEGSTNHPRPSGIITAKKGGTVNYLKTVFNVREGELQFNQIGTFFPTITFHADTKLTKTKVFLSVDGALNDRRIKLTSSPEMSETEIMNLLTLREAYQKGGDNDIEAQDLLMLGLQMSFLSEIEGVVRKTIGLDQFSINRGSGSAFDNKHEVRDRHEEEYNVTMGKYIGEKIMLKYTRGIGGDNINRYGLQYDFNDRISSTIEREGHDFIVGFEARWKF